jgi:anti-anti-sigma regulatory factor
MPRQDETEPARPLALPANFDGAAAAELRDRLEALIGPDADLVCDGSEVTRVGTQGAQLLVTAARSVAATGGRLRLNAPSSALTAAFEDLGLQNELSNWSIA